MINERYQVKLDAFEGPLDLLLHLIKQYEIDIYDIPVAQITKQYMDYIHTMQQLELNIASEYLVMASTLVAIKSQMLLPNQELAMDGELEEEEEDPRAELMKRLIEYRKFKEAASELKERENVHPLYSRPAMEAKQQEQQEEKATLFDMVNAVKKLLDRKKENVPLQTKITPKEISIENRMEEMVQQLLKHKDGLDFFKLFPEPSRSHIVVTFIALLELMKENKVFCIQEEHFERLTVYHTEE